jgi:hypothetical protein
MKVTLTCSCGKQYEYEDGDIIPQAIRCNCGEYVDITPLEKLCKN